MSRLKLPTTGTKDLFANQEILETLFLEIDQVLDKRLSDTKTYLNKLRKASRTLLRIGDYDNWLETTYAKLNTLLVDLRYMDQELSNG